MKSVLLTRLLLAGAYDLQLFGDTNHHQTEAALSNHSGATPLEKADHREGRTVVDKLACLSSDLILKLAALSILPSHSLRIQGKKFPELWK